MMKTISHTNHCAGSVDESQNYPGAAVLQTSKPSKGKRKAGKNRSIYINEKPLKKARNNSMFPLDY